MNDTDKHTMGPKYHYLGLSTQMTAVHHHPLLLVHMVGQSTKTSHVSDNHDHHGTDEQSGFWGLSERTEVPTHLPAGPGMKSSWLTGQR